MIFNKLRRIIGNLWAKQVAKVQPITLSTLKPPKPGSLWQLQSDYYFSEDSKVVRSTYGSTAIVVSADNLIITLLINGKRTCSDIWAFHDCFKLITNKGENDESE